MYPVLFSFNDIFIFSLGTFMVLGFIAFNVVIIRFSHIRKLNIKFWNNHIISLVITTIIGARVLYIATHLDRFQQDWMGVFIPDGFSFYGGILAFILLLYFYTKKHKEAFLQWTDLFASAFFVWLFFDAIGHFLDGSNYGIPSDLPWAVTIDNIASPVPYTVPIHPTQLYQAIYTVGIFILLWRVYRSSALKGMVTFVGGFLLGTFDFFLNYLLGENTTMIGTLRFDQAIDLVFIALCGGLLFSLFVKKQEI